MNDLVYLKNDEPVCDSLQVAEKFGKRHSHVLEKIEKIIADDLTENSAQCFKITSYKDDTGKQNKMYLMNRDGFTFLVMVSFVKLIETSFFRLNETFYDIDTRYPAKYLQEYSHIV